jgi:hypothetical protein
MERVNNANDTIPPAVIAAASYRVREPYNGAQQGAREKSMATNTKFPTLSMQKALTQMNLKLHTVLAISPAPPGLRSCAAF